MLLAKKRASTGRVHRNIRRTASENLMVFHHQAGAAAPAPRPNPAPLAVPSSNTVLSDSDDEETVLFPVFAFLLLLLLFFVFLCEAIWCVRGCVPVQSGL